MTNRRLVLLLTVLPALALPAGAQALRLDAATAGARAVAASQLLASARARSAGAASRVASADAAVLPTVAAQATLARRSSVPEFSLPFSVPGQPSLVLMPDITTTYGATLKAQEVLYAGGAISAGRAAAREDEAVARAATLQATAEVKLAGIAVYWEVVRLAAAVEAAKATEARVSALLDDTRALKAAGMAVDADVLAAEERLATARLGVVRAEGQAGSGMARLRSLLDVPAGVEIELADTLARPLPGRPGSLVELQGEALTRRPELLAASAQMAGLDAREVQASSPRRPAVAAVAQLDYARPNARYFPQQDQWNDSWSVGVLASWTLFDGGKAAADAAAVRAQRDAAAADEAELRRRIALEVEVAHRDLETALDALVAADAARAAAVAREAATRERYQAGLVIMTEILDATSGLTNAEQTQINARAQAWLAAAALDRAVGR